MYRKKCYDQSNRQAKVKGVQTAYWDDGNEETEQVSEKWKKRWKGGKNLNNHPDGPRFKAAADRIIDLEE